MDGLDRWLTTEPEWRTEEYHQPHCEVCGCFLTILPSGHEIHVVQGTCPGSVYYTDHGEWAARCYGTDGENPGHPHDAHSWQQYMGQTDEWVCRYCHHINQREDY